VLAEVLAHDFVKGGEVGQVGQVGIELDDLVQAATGGFAHGFQVLEYLMGFSGKATFHHGHAGRVQRDLAGQVNGVASLHGLGVSTDGGRGMFGMDDFFGHLLVSVPKKQG
jgi:hypothetical protein